MEGINTDCFRSPPVQFFTPQSGFSHAQANTGIEETASILNAGDQKMTLSMMLPSQTTSTRHSSHLVKGPGRV